MRKIRIMDHIPLDGVIQHSTDHGDFPYSDWTAPYRTPAGRDAIVAAYRENGAPLWSGDVLRRGRLWARAIGGARWNSCGI